MRTLVPLLLLMVVGVAFGEDPAFTVQAYRSISPTRLSEPYRLEEGVQIWFTVTLSDEVLESFEGVGGHQTSLQTFIRYQVIPVGGATGDDFTVEAGEVGVEPRRDRWGMVIGYFVPGILLKTKNDMEYEPEDEYYRIEFYFRNATSSFDIIISSSDRYIFVLSGNGRGLYSGQGSLEEGRSYSYTVTRMDNATGSPASASNTQITSTLSDYQVITPYMPSPDANEDRKVDAADALILYYAFSLRGDLGTGR